MYIVHVLILLFCTTLCKWPCTFSRFCTWDSIEREVRLIWNIKSLIRTEDKISSANSFWRNFDCNYIIFNLCLISFSNCIHMANLNTFHLLKNYLKEIYCNAVLNLFVIDEIRSNYLTIIIKKISYLKFFKFLIKLLRHEKIYK